MLHPSYKDAYFKDAGWPSHWIKNARDMLREEFDRAYKKPDPDSEEAPPELTAPHKDSNTQGKGKQMKCIKDSALKVCYALFRDVYALTGNRPPQNMPVPAQIRLRDTSPPSPKRRRMLCAGGSSVGLFFLASLGWPSTTC